jgi:hypothetical protein
MTAKYASGLASDSTRSGTKDLRFPDDDVWIRRTRRLFPLLERYSREEDDAGDERFGDESAQGTCSVDR